MCHLQIGWISEALIDLAVGPVTGIDHICLDVSGSQHIPKHLGGDPEPRVLSQRIAAGIADEKGSDPLPCYRSHHGRWLAPGKIAAHIIQTNRSGRKRCE